MSKNFSKSKRPMSINTDFEENFDVKINLSNYSKYTAVNKNTVVLKKRRSRPSTSMAQNAKTRNDFATTCMTPPVAMW